MLDDSEEQKVVFEVVATYEVIIEADNPEVKSSQQDVGEFVSMFYSWPRWRALVHNACSELGIPNINVGDFMGDVSKMD